MEKVKPEEEFRTKDFYGAALLVTAGIKLDRLERGDNDFVTFVFPIRSIPLRRFWGGIGMAKSS